VVGQNSCRRTTGTSKANMERAQFGRLPAWRDRSRRISWFSILPNEIAHPQNDAEKKSNGPNGFKK
jgi:hypothetical protein